ncbi:MAG: 4Fe-4S dicluster domain-containing protein [Solidesulfovibrio sp. DCME]|uniref:4Fe-4S dicluster domain-containing protein n=1 Tax=Solidesulfovibrio sp. DCME TaxID=3447380 RepID=UPI003D0CCC35
MSSDACILETCRGVKPGGCRFGLPLPGGFAGELEALAGTALPVALAELGRPLRHHERLRLSLCACPNGCVRPHVADVGLLAARDVAIDAAACAGCGACRDVCPDGAIALDDGVAALDDSRCLGCGQCLAVCPAGAIAAGPTRFRALIGGRLGRRPRLGQELGRRLDGQAALGLVARCLAAHGAQARPSRRFGDIIFPAGQPGLPAWIWP